MARFDSDDDIGKPGKPLKPRRFPWRLWLFAIAMTAGAVGGGYYTWQYHRQRDTADDERDACKAELKVQVGKAAGIDAALKKAADAEKKAADATKRAAEVESLNSALTVGANASKEFTEAGRIQRVEAEKRLTVIDELQKQLAKMIEAHQLAASARRGAFVLSLPADNVFTTGTAELSKPGEMAVLEVGIALKRFSDRRFLVTGHADDAAAKPAGFKDSWELSTARAVTVTRALIQAGVDAKNLVVAGAGDTDPVAKDHAKNRRIEIALLPSTGELPALPASLGADTAKPDVPAEAPPKPDAAKPAAATPPPAATPPAATPPAPAKKP